MFTNALIWERPQKPTFWFRAKSVSRVYARAATFPINEYFPHFPYFGVDPINFIVDDIRNL